MKLPYMLVIWMTFTDALHKPVDLLTTDSLDMNFRNEISPEEVMIYEQ